MELPDDAGSWTDEHERAVLEARAKFVDVMIEKDDDFESEAFSVLLQARVIFTNSWHWKDKWPEDARRTTALCVNCNDVFAWACADAEDLEYAEVGDLWKHWRKDPSWGPAIWCMKKRKQMPQSPLEKIIRAAGVWNLDEMGLPTNTQDAEMHAFLQLALAQRHEAAEAGKDRDHIAGTLNP